MSKENKKIIYGHQILIHGKTDLRYVPSFGKGLNCMQIKGFVVIYDKGNVQLPHDFNKRDIILNPLKSN